MVQALAPVLALSRVVLAALQKQPLSTQGAVKSQAEQLTASLQLVVPDW